MKRKTANQIDEMVKAINDLKRIALDYKKQERVSEVLTDDFERLLKSYEKRILETAMEETGEKGR